MSHTDIVLLAAIVLAFAALVTTHLAIVVGLLGRTPRWRSLAALIVAPLAPYWALRARMYVRGSAWLLAAVVYLVARLLAV